MKFKVVLSPAKLTAEKTVKTAYYTEVETMDELNESLRFFEEYGLDVVSVEEVSGEPDHQDHLPG